MLFLDLSYYIILLLWALTSCSVCLINIYLSGKHWCASFLQYHTWTKCFTRIYSSNPRLLSSFVCSLVFVKSLWMSELMYVSVCLSACMCVCMSMHVCMNECMCVSVCVLLPACVPQPMCGGQRTTVRSQFCPIRGSPGWMQAPWQVPFFPRWGILQASLLLFLDEGSHGT